MWINIRRLAKLNAALGSKSIIRLHLGAYEGQNRFRQPKYQIDQGKYGNLHLLRWTALTYTHFSCNIRTVGAKLEKNKPKIRYQGDARLPSNQLHSNNRNPVKQIG